MTTEFWEKILLKEFADDCIHHVILPTMFGTRCGDANDGTDDETKKAYDDMLSCFLCKEDVKGQNVTLAVRWVLAKKNAKNFLDDSPAFIYKSSTTSAFI